MHHLASRAIADLLATAVGHGLADPVAPVAHMRNPDPRPFAKRQDGLARRNARRNVRAAKTAWLNS